MLADSIVQAIQLLGWNWVRTVQNFGVFETFFGSYTWYVSVNNYRGTWYWGYRNREGVCVCVFVSRGNTLSLTTQSSTNSRGQEPLLFVLANKYQTALGCKRACLQLVTFSRCTDKLKQYLLPTHRRAVRIHQISRQQIVVSYTEPSVYQVCYLPIDFRKPPMMARLLVWSLNVRAYIYANPLDLILLKPSADVRFLPSFPRNNLLAFLFLSCFPVMFFMCMSSCAL